VLFLSETFVTPDLLPTWFRPALALSPLTYVARGIRAVTYAEATTAVVPNLAAAAVLAIAFFALGAAAVPRTD
jgi:ABC-2 type transport system permease protein